ncbi:MAG TPA: O-antigen ligase family protein [Patescibacteria group bacterium]|nr:O-antigen ligase family protein [Patescibacteria group bacterium]
MGKRLKSVKENWLLGAVTFLLFFIPLYPKLPLFGVSGTYVSIRLEDLFVALIVGLFGLRLLIKRDFSLLKDSLVQLISLYFGVGLLSILSAVFITKNVVPHLALLHFLRRVEYFSLLFVAYYSFKNIKQLRLYGWTVLVAASGIIFYALGQKFFGWPVISTMNEEFSRGLVLQLTWWARVNSTFAGHYDLAAYMVLILPLVVVALMIVKKWRVKLPIFFLGLFSYYILLLTASRISFGAYLVGVSLVLFLAKKKVWLVPFLAISILGMVFAGDLGQRYAATFKIDLSFLSGQVKIRPPRIAQGPTTTPTPTLMLPPVTTKPGFLPTLTPTATPTPIPELKPGEYPPIESTELAVGRSTDIRLKVEWPRAIRAFLKNPLLGTGYSSITLATDNDYLRMLGEVGLLGSLAFLAVIAEIARRLVAFLTRGPKRNEELIVLGVIGAAVGYFMNASFIDVLEASKVAFFFWILVGIALKVVDLNKEMTIKSRA